VVVHFVSSGSFAPIPQNWPVGQSAGSSQATVHSPGHVTPEAIGRQLGPPVLVRQQTSVVRSHCVEPQ
jgi:hypothetical protein